jgi:hypothetical protein
VAAPSASLALNSSFPDGLNSEKYDSPPQLTNRSPFLDFFPGNRWPVEYLMSMVRRRSTVRFRNGAPAQRSFSNFFLLVDFKIK